MRFIRGHLLYLLLSIQKRALFARTNMSSPARRHLLTPSPAAKWYLRRAGQSETQLSNTAGQFENLSNGLSFKLLQPTYADQSMENTASFDSNGHDTTETSARSLSKGVRKLRNYHFSGLLQIHFTFIKVYVNMSDIFKHVSDINIYSHYS